ncbi:Uncharacterised protein [Mycobacterium tuberculosis]|uniref:Uncharacterized protein n=1 Tax=Mycobacterium tuberculosis TaxID=1773 RepID=A0A655A611_MYCTX|nr:hypothetical protein FF22_03496 [Mycobacterium tuberculosis]CEZ70351.1 Uncharacterised protein [Mycobacterium tuberculosis]CFH21477.1 Uncharacterised protein [Mycobacterium tuberculosis]CFR71672.1 Uncharacterised protein [Mycobacterium tuberculosis]CFV41390.1 Uncharacterised protein [Mycobacterium tuberculosis]
MCSPQPPRPRRKPAPTRWSICSATLGRRWPTRCWPSCWWQRRWAPTPAGRPRWACSPRCWSPRCRARRGWRCAGCARSRWTGSVMSRRPNVSCWRPSRWTPSGRCRCSTWPASPPIAATPSAGWHCCAAPAPNPTTRWCGSWSGTEPSRAATWAATRRAGAGRAASTRNAISAVRRCRWPSGWTGCMPRHPSTHCRATGPACWPKSAMSASGMPTLTMRTRWPRRWPIRWCWTRCCSRAARSRSSSKCAVRCYPTTSGCLPSNGCSWSGRCSRSSTCNLARA